MTNQYSSGAADRREFWKQQLEAFSRSGMTLQAFCTERKLTYSSFCSWRRRLGGAPRKKAQDVIAVTVLPEALAGKSEGLRMRVEGIQIEFSDSPEPQWLASVLLAVGSRRAESC